GELHKSLRGLHRAAQRKRRDVAARAASHAAARRGQAAINNRRSALFREVAVCAHVSAIILERHAGGIRPGVRDRGGIVTVGGPAAAEGKRRAAVGVSEGG